MGAGFLFCGVYPTRLENLEQGAWHPSPPACIVICFVPLGLGACFFILPQLKSFLHLSFSPLPLAYKPTSLTSSTRSCFCCCGCGLARPQPCPGLVPVARVFLTPLWERVGREARVGREVRVGREGISSQLTLTHNRPITRITPLHSNPTTTSLTHREVKVIRVTLLTLKTMYAPSRNNPHSRRHPWHTST